MPKSALEELTKAGKIAPESVADLASNTLGMALPTSAAKPDTGGVDDFRRWLLGDNAIVMTDPAVGGIGSAHFLSLLQRPGIADAMKSRLVVTPV